MINLKADVSSSNLGIFEVINFQKQYDKNTINVGNILKPIILKNNQNHNQADASFDEKTKKHNNNKLIKK